VPATGRLVCMAAGNLPEAGMRLRAKGSPGRFNDLEVAACMWPRSRYSTGGMPNQPRNQYTAYRNRDREEILAYIKRHGPCSTFDLELCMHQEKAPVMRHLAGLLRQGQIETCYFCGEKFRAIP